MYAPFVMLLAPLLLLAVDVVPAALASFSFDPIRTVWVNIASSLVSHRQPNGSPRVRDTLG